MFKSIVAVTFVVLISLPGVSASGATLQEENPLSPAPSENSSASFLNILAGSYRNDPSVTDKGRYTLKPNTRLAEKANLRAFCFSPVDSVVHYIGANVGDDQTAPEDAALEALAAKPAEDESGWTVQLGAGVERKLTERAAFDLDYRYTSSPVEFDLNAIQAPSDHEHHISAGMKLFF